MRFIIYWCLLFSIALNATNSIQGQVYDKDSKSFLPFCTVKLSGEINQETSCDSAGFFQFKGIPFGNFRIKIYATGYYTYEQTLVLESGNSLKLTIFLSELVHVLEEVQIEAKNTNPYKNTSFFEFESKDFKNTSATLGDPSRIVQGLPGVLITNDYSNNVSIRGNSPSNNNWYLDGTEIPNPNHFSSAGGSGGVIGIFNENSLNGFDFYSGGYPATYGNSNSGIFDLYLRKGNRLKRESTSRVSFTGAYLGTEGYVKKNKGSTYILNLRLFDLSFLQKSGLVNSDRIGLPTYNDYSFKLNFPLNQNTELSIFGFGGKSKLDLPYGSYKDLYNNLVFSKNVSLNHSFTKKAKACLILQYNKTENGLDTKSPVRLIEEQSNESILRTHLYYNQKINSRFSYRVGGIISVRSYNYFYKNDYIFDSLSPSTTKNYQTTILEGYINTRFKINQFMSFIGGIHYLQPTYNNKINFEPRLGLETVITEKYKINLGTGFYSKIQPLITQMYNTKSRELPLIRSFQITNAHNFFYDSTLFFKTEIYYQYLYNVYLLNDPIQPFARATTINYDGYSSGGGINAAGIGRNMGIEFFAKKTFKKNLESLLSISIFDSKYRDAEKVWRSTRYDSKFNFVLQINKNYVKQKSYGLKTITISSKVLNFGGLYNIPVNLKSSRTFGETQYNSDMLFTEKAPNYFRIDFGFQINYSKSKVRHELRLDIQNVSNHKNVLKPFYNTETFRIENTYQLPIIPVLSYGLMF